MANCDNLFRKFNENLQVLKSKKDAMKVSKSNLREKIKADFKKNHPKYVPTFYTQGSEKTKNMNRTKDDTCDLDDGVYFKDNPDNVTGTTLQGWVKDAVEGTTEATPSHRKKCITVDYKAGYNIDLPVFLFDKSKENHPRLAVKGEDFREDDPKEFIEEFNRIKDAEGQLIRQSKYLKDWCDNVREKMPSGIVMTVLCMNHLQKNSRDDISLKYTLIEIEKDLKKSFKCIMPTTPKDDLLADYSEDRKNNFLKRLADFISDAKRAVDEEQNQLKASKLWQKHLGKLYFPDGEDKDEERVSASHLTAAIGSSKPYFEIR